MTEISNIKVYDLEECMVASGYPMQTEVISELSDNDLKRCIRLCKTKSNSGHANFLTGIRVSFDLKYPQYLTPQLQRYNFIDIVSSQSKMHRLAKMEISASCNEYVSEVLMDAVKVFQDLYNENPTYENYMRLISSLPMGFELTMRVSTNYMQLKNIYHQRKHHKLKEDWGAIIQMIERLPFFSEFILPNGK